MSKPRSLFYLTVVYLVVLLLSAWAYNLISHNWPEFHRDWLQDRTYLVAVGWSGSLGGVIANITGLASNRRKWNPDWDFWYAARPLTSGVVAVIGYMIYISLVQASLFPDKQPDLQDLKPSFLGFAIAFAIGFREDVFRDLLQRVFELIAGAGGADTQPPSSPPDFRGEPISGGTQAKLTWGHATDNVAVVAYNLYRDNRLLATIKVTPPASGDSDERIQFIDGTVCKSHTYAVTAADDAGNESIMSGPICVRLQEGEGTEPAGISIESLPAPQPKQDEQPPRSSSDNK